MVDHERGQRGISVAIFAPFYFVFFFPMRLSLTGRGFMKPKFFQWKYKTLKTSSTVIDATYSYGAMGGFLVVHKVAVTPTTNFLCMAGPRLV